VSTYVNPAYMTDHYGVAIGAAAITTKYATVAGFGKDRLIDYRGSLLMKFSASQADHDVEFDLNSISGRLHNRLLIPTGHNLSGVTARVYTGATSPAATEIASGVLDANNWLDLSYSNQTARYVRVKFDATGTWELGELWIGGRFQPTTGIAVAWEAPYLSPAVQVDFPAREHVALLASPRKRFLLKHHGIVEASDDDLGYIFVAQRGLGSPLLFWPPLSGGEPFIARLEGDAPRVQDFPVPKVALSYRYELDLREQLP